CRLGAPDAWIEQRSQAIRFPSYYRPRFSADELEIIERNTAVNAARFGYSSTAATPAQLHCPA
ncbi:MAG TPA: hypothetical protein VFG43_00545, partial [Geminicoccaceae bacterium]|nr:hypothetical protein [Geminicoccaceae bacterium]